MDVALWVIQVILALLYSLAAIRKILMIDKVRASQPWAEEYSDTQLRLVAFSQLLGVLGIILPMLTGVLPWLTPIAAIGFCIIQILAFQLRYRRKEYGSLPINVLLFALSLFVAIGRWDLLMVLTAS